jgi:hypothetical protein
MHEVREMKTLCDHIRKSACFIYENIFDLD